MSLVQSEAGSIELGETNVLPGVLDHEVRSATGPTGRIHIHAIAGNPLEQLDLSGGQLARVLREIVRVDAVERLVALELPVLSSHLAVAPSLVLLSRLRPGRNIPACTRCDLPAQGSQFRPQRLGALGRSLDRTEHGRYREGHEQLLLENTTGGRFTFQPFSYIFHWMAPHTGHGPVARPPKGKKSAPVDNDHLT